MNRLRQAGRRAGELLKPLDSFELSVPGNILLCGEYAVTEKGGRGIALAVERRAVLICNRDPFGLVPSPPEDANNETALTTRNQGLVCGARFSFVTSGAVESVHLADISSPASDTPALLSAVLETMSSFLARRSAPLAIKRFATANNTESGRTLLMDEPAITVDTSAFFDVEGRKTGLGSSAAACLLLTVGIAQILELSPKTRTELFSEIAYIAVNAHRQFQKGKGSGYDVVCSFIGGAIEFVGGPRPFAKPLPGLSAFLPRFELYEGPHAVKTVSALERYAAHKNKSPASVRSYLSATKNIATNIAHARDWQSLSRHLERTREAGIRFGQAIGVGATIPEPAANTGILFYKAVGAGNETGIAFRADGREQAAATGLTIRDLYRGTSRGKLVLYGEHAAVYGYPACGVSLEAYSEMRFVPAPAAASESHADGGSPNPKPGFPGLNASDTAQAQAALTVALEQFPGEVLPPGHFEYSSTVPRSGGFGSSAAVGVAMTRLLSGMFSSPLDPNELWKKANAIDSYFHGKASGLDTGLSSRAGLWGFDLARFHAKPIQCRSQSLYLVYAAVPRLGATKKLVGALRMAYEAGEIDTVSNIESLGAIATEAIRKLEADAIDGNPHVLLTELGRLSHRAQIHLDALRLNDCQYDFLATEALAAGSPGVKMSGAAAGGAFYAWARNKSHARYLAAHLAARAKDAGDLLSLEFEPRVLAVEAGRPDLDGSPR